MNERPQIKPRNQLKEYFDEYINECRYIKGLREDTIRNYNDFFSIFQKIVPEIREIQSFTPDNIHQFFIRLSQRERPVGRNKVQIGIRPSTLRTYYNRLMVFVRWLEQKKYISEDIGRGITKPPQPRYEDDRALKDEEVAKIISAITLHTHDNLFLYTRDTLIVHLLLYTGIRRGELIGLRIQDINFEEKTLYINGDTSKSKYSRYIPLKKNVLIILRSYLEQRKKMTSQCPALIISSKTDTPLTKHGLKHWVEKYSELSGVKFHLHRFRHTFACNLAKANADVPTIMKVLGHSNVTMTAQYLRSIRTENARSFIDKL